MNTVCARATCAGRVAGVFVTDMPACTAWLVDLDTNVEGVGLCPTHLNRFSVPMGWTLIDQRSGSITSIEPPAPAAAPIPDPALHEPVRLDPDPAPPSPEPADVAAEATAALDADDSDAPTGRWDGPARADAVSGPAAESPLLARAFGGPDDSPRRMALFGGQQTEDEDDDTLPFPPDGPAAVPGS